MKQKVILAAGGTGGHIYPAIAVADVLKKSNLDILFWGATQGLENKIVPQANYSLTTVKMGRLNSNVRKSERLLTLFLLPLAFLKAIYILLMNRPLFVLGFGGHASAPLLLASRIFLVIFGSQMLYQGWPTENYHNLLMKLLLFSKPPKKR